MPQVATPSGASAPPRTDAPETRRSAYAFPIHACERCWHGESELTIHNKVLTACPKCGGTMREVGIPVTDAPQPCDLLCLVCARVKPWGIWDQTSGIAVCVECRDKARKPSPRAGEPETQWPITNLLGITPERWHEIVETASTEDPVVRYWCKACPLTFTDADTANAHHDATGHNQTHRAPTVPSADTGGAAETSHPCPFCDEPCCCAEFYDGQPCYHHQTHGCVASLRARLAESETKAALYDRINTPEIDDFLSAVHNEALHQRERWNVEHDGGKEAADWFWLVGYLAGKALHDVKGKRLHHIITAAAALLNWHGKETGHYAAMRPGIADPAAALTPPEPT